MAVDPTIRYEQVENLWLDPKNPRLGRNEVAKGLSQAQILGLMKDWELEELATSFIESGFWPQEALIVTTETIDGQERLVVIEGNRRLAALKILRGERPERLPGALRQITEEITPEQAARLTEVPCIRADTRRDVQEFLGFRHVSGIKQWEPAEKAEFIAHLIDDLGYSYEQVMRKIGSKTEPVRRNYISYRMLLQMEQLEEIDVEAVESSFSVLFLSLRTAGAQQFLHVDIKAPPELARHPVPDEHIANLVKFAKWLFGTRDEPPLVPESRDVDRFGKILESAEALEYLETARRPMFTVAFMKAGGDREEVLAAIERAAFDVEQALGTVHLYIEDERVQGAVERLGLDCKQLLRIFPMIADKVNAPA